MAQTSETKTPDAWKQKVANAERETVIKCRKSIKNIQNSRS